MKEKEYKKEMWGLLLREQYLKNTSLEIQNELLKQSLKERL